MPKAARGAIALCLLLLAASPFTAPFSTFEFDQLSLTASVDAAKAKPHKDLSSWVASPAVTSVCTRATADRPGCADGRRPRALPLRAILRI